MKNSTEISKIVYLTASYSVDSLKSSSDEQGDEENNENFYIFIKYEFIFLFIHLLSREFQTKYGYEKSVKIIDEIGHRIINASMEAMYKNLTAEDHKKIKDKMIENLNDAEKRYGSCKYLISTDVPFSDDAVFSLFSKYILKILNQENNPFTMTKIMTIAMTGWSYLKDNYN